MPHFDLNHEYRTLTSHYPNHSARPVIGITGNFGENGTQLAEGYSRAIELAGGIPVVIPPTENRVLLASLLDRVDGLLLSGGADINPLYLGEEPLEQLGGINAKRDFGELLLTRLAYDRNVPILGICRGIQVLIAALGGRIHQDIATGMPERPMRLKHSQTAAREEATHSITTTPGSIVRELLGERVFVNSFHHQAVADPGPRFAATAVAPDGVIEAVESTEMKPAMGVQWHPEAMVLGGDKQMKTLFRYFVDQAERFRQARDMHASLLTLDSHCDTPMKFADGAELCVRRDDVLVDLHRMAEGHLDAVVMAAYIPQGPLTPEGHAGATALADELIYSIKEMVLDNPNGAHLATTSKHIFNTKANGRKAVLIGIENGYALGEDLANIRRYKREGVVYITLCHNGDNLICDAASKSEATHGGLSEFGRKVVTEMNDVGLIVDLSHAAESTFYDVLALSQQPVICSHSSARALCDHPRNLTDDQLRALAKADGVAQATFYHGFLRAEGEATIADAVAHILHMVDVAGIDHVGIGSDFDGDGGVRGLASAADYLLLTELLMAEGFTQPQLRKLWGGNFLRVMNRVQAAGHYL